VGGGEDEGGGELEEEAEGAEVEEEEEEAESGDDWKALSGSLGGAGCAGEESAGVKDFRFMDLFIAARVTRGKKS